MANEYEMYDYVSTVAADYDYTLDMQPHNVLVEDGQKRIHIKKYDDGSETRIERSNQSDFYVTLEFEFLDEEDAGILFDLYHNTSKANGKKNSFKWLNYGEPAARRHTYVVRFDSALPRHVRPAGSYQFTQIIFRVLGRIADS